MRYSLGGSTGLAVGICESANRCRGCDLTGASSTVSGREQRRTGCPQVLDIGDHHEAPVQSDFEAVDAGPTRRIGHVLGRRLPQPDTFDVAGPQALALRYLEPDLFSESRRSPVPPPGFEVVDQ